MKKSIFALLVALVASTCMMAQNAPVDFNNYKALKCAGTIPEDFRMLSQEKYKQDVKEEAKNSRNHNVNATKHEFLLETNYIIDELLLSGKVLFGDSVTNYVNTVADHVLINQPELRAKLRFYCLKSSEVNAFSTNQGIIFITLGLVAQLENEAQLAFIISHEVAHYERHHTMNEYIRQKQIFSDNNNYKYNTYDDQIRTASSYSKELELEADSIGIARLSKTGYDCGEAISSFFVLQFSELPFEDFEFEGKFLENSIMELPADLFLDSVRPINLENDMDDDSYSSHPNIATRRKRLESILEGMSDCGVQKFASSEQSFYTVRKICRFETVRIMLNRKDYVSALYNSYVLQKEDSTSSYLKLTIGKALYGMAKYKNHGDYSDVSEYYGKKEGNQQQCYHVFGQVNAAQLNMLALRYLYNLSQTDSTNHIITAMCNDLAEEAVRMNDIHYVDMKKTLALYLEMKKDTVDTTAQKVVVKEENKTPESDSKAYVSKYDKLRQAKKNLEKQEATETKKSDASKYYLLAFADIIDNSSVKAMFDAAEATAAEKHALGEAEKAKRDKMSSYEVRKMEQQKNSTNKKQGLSLGIDTVVFVDPFYYMADDRKGLKRIQSETQQLEFSAQVRENAGYAGLSIELLNPKSFTANDVEKYNDMAVVNDWMGERLDHEDDLGMLPLETDRMLPLVEKYNTSHFCYTGVYTYKQKREGRGFIILLSVFVYPVLPFAIAYALTPEHHTFYYTLMYDVKTGDPDVKNTVHLKSKSKQGYINSIMYDMMLQIKRDKKTKATKTTSR
ncbi:MAG: M48 family metalloprotease [Bacteroidota bacterium]|nr:M48 family metalloprotease [Bacteroidota bacterium]